MLPIFNGLRDLNMWTVLFRMVVAFICGSVIGIERTYSNKPAGFRTHILVTIGATIASMTGMYLYLVLKLPTDISRMGTQVIAGLGFIGTGTIIVTREKTVSGLTTAAGLWVAGIIGLAIGAGFYEGAIITFLITLFVETTVSELGRFITKPGRLKIALSYYYRHDLGQVMSYLKEKQINVVNLQITGNNEDIEGKFYSVLMTLNPRHPVDENELVTALSSMDGIISAGKLDK
ncbi:MAG: MgtC/SapB family protein [Erysipelotrichales bacterium]|nr:MgtC/SapB family protein [Erysipelotrichales bacterium]MBQ1386666.1 MgtC/SapB family protein [Erysipelotrichales bacterium]MBQ2309133.1 MgtC/SapB family protein [Erysipelotrichales bacterium]MBQ2479538.1 MgtC/SapB family protein [Erysipelotrichales bacterium]MBQ4011934.1 MgtC/SapB family protein [Erysipelotrichales bacterium]